MKNLSLILALVLVFGISVSVKANDNKKEAKHDLKVQIEPHALIALSSTDGITLTPAAPTTAGEGLNFNVASASNSTVWLQYSSIRRNNDNKITVSMSGDQLPNGVTVEVEAADDAHKGKGKTGSSYNKKVTLSNGPQDLINDIGNCFTGTGNGAGHKLTYTLKMTDNSNYQNLLAKDYANVITYTITEN